MAWVGPSKRTASCGICGLEGSETKALTSGQGVQLSDVLVPITPANGRVFVSRRAGGTYFTSAIPAPAADRGEGPAAIRAKRQSAVLTIP